MPAGYSKHELNSTAKTGEGLLGFLRLALHLNLSEHGSLSTAHSSAVLPTAALCVLSAAALLCLLFP